MPTLDRESRDHRDLWLPGLVGLVGALISLATWGLMVAERRAQLLEGTSAISAETRAAVERGLDQQMLALRGLTGLWSEFGLGSAERWEAEADREVDQVAGLVSVAWVGPEDSPIRIANGSDVPPGDAEVDALQARLFEEPTLVGPLDDARGEVEYRFFLPVATPDAGRGVLVARLQVTAFLEALLQARAPGYAISVWWNGDPIFSSGAASADPWQGWWRSEEMLRLPLGGSPGGSWRVVHRPTPAYAAARLTPLPHYLLAVGFLLSLALAFLAHQLRLTVRQSRFLAASNRSLEQRGEELESRVADRTEALEDAIAELEAFNYSVSHDLRSPLGAILNFTAILEEDYRGEPLDEEALRILARIRRSATRATALLEDLLQLSRAGRAALDLEPIDMAALTRESFAQIRAAQDDGDDASDVEFVVEPLPDAVGDRALLGGVLANLLSNALKYSRGREKRRIRVTGRLSGDEWIYEVVDNGQGFDMRFADKLFGLFERLHSAEDVEGTGVGLAMVARIVKRHGGRVWGHGKPGEGARFGFALPRRDADVAPGPKSDGEMP